MMKIVTDTVGVSPRPGQESNPVGENKGANPDFRRVTLADYRRILEETFTPTAQQVAELNRLITLARYRDTTIPLGSGQIGQVTLGTGITQPANTINIPDMDWVTLVASRPMKSEISIAYPHDFVLYFGDRGRGWRIPPNAVTIIPVAGEHTLAVYGTAVVPAGLTLELLLTTRLYDPSIATAALV